MRNIIGIIIFCLALGACNDKGLDTNLIVVGDENGNIMYINKKGKTVLKPENGAYTYFFDGLAESHKDGKCGFINKKGKQVIENQYKRVLSFSEGVTWAVKENGHPELIDTKGNVKFTLEQAESVRAFHDGLAVFTTIGDDGKNKYGCVNKSGKTVIEPQENQIFNFYQGKAIVTNRNDYKKGYIDQSGKIIINCQFDEAGDFSKNGLACVKFGEKYGVINTKGEYVINPQFEWMMTDGDLFIFSVDRKYGWCDKDGKYIINPQFSKVFPFSTNDLAPVSNDDKTWGYINKKGIYTINPQFEMATSFLDNEIAIVNVNNKVGFINKEGKYIVNPQYERIGTSIIELVAFGKSLFYSPSIENDYFDTEGIVNKVKNMITEDAIDGVSYDASVKNLMEKYNLNASNFNKNKNFTQLKEGKFSTDVKYTLNMDGNPWTVVKQGWFSNYEMNTGYVPESYTIAIALEGGKKGREVELMEALYKAFFDGELNKTLLYEGAVLCNYGYPECRLSYAKNYVTVNVRKGKTINPDTSILSGGNNTGLKISISDKEPCDGGGFTLTIAGGKPLADKNKPFTVESKPISGEGKIYVERFFVNKEGLYSVEVTTSTNTDESKQELTVTDADGAKATANYTVYNCP